MAKGNIMKYWDNGVLKTVNGSSGNGGSYVLPAASKTALGGIKAAPAQAGDTKGVYIGDDQMLHVTPDVLVVQGTNEGGSWKASVGSETIRSFGGEVILKAEVDGIPYIYRYQRYESARGAVFTNPDIKAASIKQIEIIVDRDGNISRNDIPFEGGGGYKIETPTDLEPPTDTKVLWIRTQGVDAPGDGLAPEIITPLYPTDANYRVVADGTDGPTVCRYGDIVSVRISVEVKTPDDSKYHTIVSGLPEKLGSGGVYASAHSRDNWAPVRLYLEGTDLKIAGGKASGGSAAWQYLYDIVVTYVAADAAPGTASYVNGIYIYDPGVSSWILAASLGQSQGKPGKDGKDGKDGQGVPPIGEADNGKTLTAENGLPVWKTGSGGGANFVPVPVTVAKNSNYEIVQVRERPTPSIDAYVMGNLCVVFAEIRINNPNNSAWVTVARGLPLPANNQELIGAFIAKDGTGPIRVKAGQDNAYSEPHTLQIAGGEKTVGQFSGTTTITYIYITGE